MYKSLSPINPASIPIRPFPHQNVCVELSGTRRAHQTLLVDLDGLNEASFAFDAQAHCEGLCVHQRQER
jgi:hypothetical protein